MTEPGDRVDLMAPPTPEDPRNSADLLARASDGDAMAWEELFRRYNRLVRSTVASFRLQEADADEAVQNTWLRVMERMDTIRDPERLGGWLATTASRECLALIRRRHREVLKDVALWDTLEQRGFVSQYGADVVEDVKGEPTEGDRTGSYLLDDLLDKADQALREKLEPKVTDIRIGSTQGTGDAQLDDLLQRADAALRAALHEQGTTLSGYLPRRSPRTRPARPPARVPPKPPRCRPQRW
jgi:RNA polymerase sigma factor (sigma-70 family)